MLKRVLNIKLKKMNGRVYDEKAARLQTIINANMKIQLLEEKDENNRRAAKILFHLAMVDKEKLEMLEEKELEIIAENHEEVLYVYVNLEYIVVFEQLTEVKDEEDEAIVEQVSNIIEPYLNSKVFNFFKEADLVPFNLPYNFWKK